jgi:hypothetical protein
MSEYRWGKDTYPGSDNVRVVCYECGKQFMLADGWFDMAGEPFKAYYCNECKEKADA